MITNNHNNRISPKMPLIVLLIIGYIFINPILTIIIYTIYIQKVDKNNVYYWTSSLNIQIVLLAAFLGYINISKELISDLYAYYLDFISHDIYSTIPPIEIIKKDPLFVCITFVFNKMSGGNFEVYIFSITFISYILLFYSYMNILKKDPDIDKHDILFSLMALFLFYELFSLSGHLIRQFIAGSLFMYGYSLKLIGRRHYIIIYIIALLIHNSVAVPIAISIFPYQQTKSLFFNIGLLLICILPLLVIIEMLIINIGPFSTKIPFIYEPVERFLYSSNIERHINIFQELISVIIYVIIIILIYLQLTKRLTHELQPMIRLFIGVFIMTIMIYNKPLLCQRLFLYLYYMMPIIFILITKEIFRKIATRNIIYISLTIILLARFLYKLNNGVFQYLPTSDLIFNPVIVNL